MSSKVIHSEAFICNKARTEKSKHKAVMILRLFNSDYNLLVKLSPTLNKKKDLSLSSYRQQSSTVGSVGKYEFLSLEEVTVPTLTLHTLKTTAKQDRDQWCHPSTYLEIQLRPPSHANH